MESFGCSAKREAPVVGLRRARRKNSVMKRWSSLVSPEVKKFLVLSG